MGETLLTVITYLLFTVSKVALHWTIVETIERPETPIPKVIKQNLFATHRLDLTQLGKYNRSRIWCEERNE